MLKDIELPSHRQFISNKEWEPLYFFSECLANSKTFDLSLGFFSSSAIRTLACSFASFIYHGGKMRLIINNILSEDDKNTIIRGENGDIHRSFDLSNILQLRNVLSSQDEQFFDCLAWLIANERIEIVVVEPLDGNGIAHTKSGVFFDGESHISFNGSCNFTKTALLDNIESIDAYCDWDGDVMVAKTKNIIKDFNDKFHKDDNSVKYIDPKDIICSVQKYFRTKPMSELLAQEQVLIERELKNAAFIGEKLRPNIRKALDKAKKQIELEIEEEERTRNLPKFPYPSPKDYQLEALSEWKKNDQQGLFAMATGTGKTITSLNCLLEIYKKLHYYKAVILVPTITLVNQWEVECRKFNFNNIIKVFSKNHSWKTDIDTIIIRESIESKENPISYVVISTYASFAKETVFNLVNSLSPRTLLIADECHNMGSGKIRTKLNRVKFKRRIGLSATPDRQYDEVGNQLLLHFFHAEAKYTFEYTMAQAIQKGALCRYKYYPHIVRLTEDEMSRYYAISKQIAKYCAGGELDLDNDFLTELLLKRKRIIHKAANKIPAFEQIVQKEYESRGELKYTLVYVPEGIIVDEKPSSDIDYFGTKDYMDDDEDSDRLIDIYTSVIKDLGETVTVKKFTSNSTGRDKTLQDFADGKIGVLTSMKCLDEGVDVPRSELAVFCSSTGNPRQFIQRRGRILRTHPQKKMAFIHDLVVIPDIDPSMESYNIERNLMRSELSRVRNFALLSENSNYTFDVLEPILDYYNISLFNTEE